MATNNAANFGTGTAGQVLTSNGAGVAPTFQAAAAGGSAPSAPPWVNSATTLWWGPGPISPVSTLTPVANQTYLTPFINYQTFTITAIGVTCSGPFSGSNDTVRLGIYTITQSTGAATLLADFGVATVNGTGVKSVGSLSQAVAPGSYYVAAVFASANNIYRTTDNLEASFIDTTGTFWHGFLYNNGASTLPASITQAQIGAATTGKAMKIYLQYTQ